MNTVVVTGATSMIGSALIRSLLNHNVKKIYAVIRANSENINKLPDSNRIFPVYCECANYDQLPSLISDQCDSFYHFAWIHSIFSGRERYFDVEVGYQNIGQTLKALKAASSMGCKTFIGAGSQAEYGNRRELVQAPNDPTDPFTAYGIAKDTCRRLCMLKGNQLGIEVQWVRIFSVYGSHDRKNTLISTILPKMQRNEDIELTDCTQIWEYLYEDDAGESLYYVGLAKGSNIFCLGSGDAKPLKLFVEEMKAITNSNSNLKFGSIPHSGEAVMNLHADIFSLRARTGWSGPKISFKEGISYILEKLKAGDE